MNIGATRRSRCQLAGLHCLFIALLILTVERAPAEDADRFRPYVQWRLGEFAPEWGVQDLRGISAGANFDLHWGAELALDAWQLNLDVPPSSIPLGEEQIITLMPQVRYRLPVWNNRLVPYAIAGAGGAWIQFNDLTSAGASHQIAANGITWSATIGAGVDFFLNDNIAFNLEAKYVWCDPITVKLDGNRRTWDPSSILATMGLRIYFGENHRQPLLTKADVLSPVRLYFGFYGGLDYLTDGNLAPGAELSPKLNALGNTLDLAYILAPGADLGEHLSLQLDLAYSEYSVNLDSTRVGEYSVYSAMPIFRWRFPSANGRWVPYALAGLGASYGEVNDVTPEGFEIGTSGKGLYPGVMVGCGIDYFMNRNLALSFETRWRYSWSHELMTNSGASRKGDLSDFMFGIGLRAYLFEFGNKMR